MSQQTSAAAEQAASRQSVIDAAWNIVLAAAAGAEGAAHANKSAAFAIDDDPAPSSRGVRVPAGSRFCRPTIRVTP